MRIISFWQTLSISTGEQLNCIIRRYPRDGKIGWWCGRIRSQICSIAVWSQGNSYEMFLHNEILLEWRRLVVKRQTSFFEMHILRPTPSIKVVFGCGRNAARCEGELRLINTRQGGHNNTPVIFAVSHVTGLTNDKFIEGGFRRQSFNAFRETVSLRIQNPNVVFNCYNASCHNQLKKPTWRLDTKLRSHLWPTLYLCSLKLRN